MLKTYVWILILYRCEIWFDKKKTNKIESFETWRNTKMLNGSRADKITNEKVYASTKAKMINLEPN